MAKVPKLVSGGGKAPAKFSEFTKRKTRRRIPFISVSDVVFPDIVFAYNPIKNFTNSKIGPDPVWSYTAPNYNDDGSYTGSTPWWNTDLLRWEWGGPSYTQFAQNSKFEGAGIGVSPAGWGIATATTNGITYGIVGFGPGYIDVRFSGTCVGSIVYPVVIPSSYAIPIAVLSDVWSGAAKITLLAGDWSAVNPSLELREATSANGYLISSSASLIGKSGQIVAHTRAFANASVGKCILMPFAATITVGTSVDFTVRIEQPQLTKTSSPMPYIATGVGETITCNSVPQPRIDAGKGLWGGPQVANVLPAGAEDFANSFWVKTNLSYNSQKLTATVTEWSRIQPAGYNLTGGITYTLSVLSKYGNCSVALGTAISDGSTAIFAKFSLSNGTVFGQKNCTAHIQSVGDGFYLCSIILTPPINTSACISIWDEATGAAINYGNPRSIINGYVFVKNPQLVQSSVPVPYVPPGATQPSNAATTGNNGLNIPMDAGMLNFLGASGASAMTLMHEAYMGVGSVYLKAIVTHSFITCNNTDTGILYNYGGPTQHPVVRSYDGVNIAGTNVNDTWSPNEIHRRYVQTTPLFGGRFRVGYQRFTSSMVEITAGIQWSHTGDESTWAVFDNSFNPLTYLRFGLSLSVPVWHRGCWMSNKTLFADEIALRNIKIANV